jgi:hypothetical protein
MVTSRLFFQDSSAFAVSAPENFSGQTQRHFVLLFMLRLVFVPILEK